MAEPTNSLNFKDLLIKVTQKAGTAYYGYDGQQRALPPIDIHDLEMCKDVVNKAMRMFISDAPPTGWRWRRRIMSLTMTGTRITGIADDADSTSVTDLTLATAYTTTNQLVNYYVYILTGTGIGSYAKVTAYNKTTGKVTVAAWLDQYGNSGGITPVVTDTFAITKVETVGGDIARYPLPANYCGEIDGKIKYAADSNHGTRIDWDNESTIRAMRELAVQSGYPSKAAIRPLEPVVGQSGPTRRWEIIFDPEPMGDYVVEWPFVIGSNKLDAETGEADSGGNTTLVDATRLEGDDYFNGWKITITSGTGKGSYAIVTDYTGSTGTFTVADWLTVAGASGGTNPAVNSSYYVEPVNNLLITGVAFDEVVEAACLAQASLDYENISPSLMEMYVKKALPQAYLIDARSAPKKLGGRVIRERVWKNVEMET